MIWQQSETRQYGHAMVWRATTSRVEVHTASLVRFEVRNVTLHSALTAFFTFLQPDFGCERLDIRQKANLHSCPKYVSQTTGLKENDQI